MSARRHKTAWRIGAIFLALVALWAVLAYVVLPFGLSHYEHQRGLAPLDMVTHTADGMAGDPLNVGIVGSKEELVAIMAKAGWHPADPITFRTSVDIIGSVVLDRAYSDAPVSPLFYMGRRQDLAFEKAVGISADRRQHVRFWLVLPTGSEGRPVWLGSASFDVGVGVSHYTGAVTHAISPDVDATRDRLSADLAATGEIAQTYEVTGVGPTINGRNGEGDRYWTDGDIRFSVIAPAGSHGSIPPQALPNPPLVDLKNQIWGLVSGAIAAPE